MNAKQKAKFQPLIILAIAGMITILSVFVITYEHRDSLSTMELPVTPAAQTDLIPEIESTVMSEPEFLPKHVAVIQALPKDKPASTSFSKVLPPLNDLHPESQTTNIDPAIGGSIECETGSVVHVPPNAFVDAKGKPVKSEVKLKFNEYHNYKEIFFSGIPMVYSVNGKDNQFESAGMMQLEASADDKAVYMSPGARIKVLLASAEKSPDYNLYYFDKEKGNWIERGKDKVTYKKKPVVRRENKLRYAAYNPKKREIHLSSFDNVPEDKVFLWWRSPATEFDFSFINLSKSFPELKALAPVKWEYKGTDAKEVYAALFNVPQRDKNVTNRRGLWDRYTVVLDKESVTATFVFISDESSVTVTARPKDRSEKNMIKARQRMNTYETTYAKRLKDDESKYLVYQNDSIDFVDRRQPVMETELAVMRTFEIDNLGIWNVDKIANNNKFVAFNIEFVDENDNPIIMDAVYLADKEFNSVFRYGNPAKNKVLLNPYSNNMIWTVLPGNRLAVAGREQLWKLAGTKGKQKVVMRVREDAIASIEDAREELNF